MTHWKQALNALNREVLALHGYLANWPAPPPGTPDVSRRAAPRGTSTRCRRREDPCAR